MARISLDHIAHAYRPNPERASDYALREISHTWEDGGAYALLGPSGCGKTTLLNVISGLITPSRGKLLFDGRDVTHLPTEARNIAQVFQFPVIYDTMTVYDNLAFPLRNRRADRADIDKAVRDVAIMLDLESKLFKRAAGLTADEKQKISLGRGLVRKDVAAILFDEPLTVIDPHLKWVLRSELKALHKRFGFTMIYVTHDQTEALTFADRVVVMHDGAVVQIDTPEGLYERPRHTFVGYFIGSPGMNIFPADVEGAMARIGPYTFDLGAAYPPLRGKVEIGIRPEFVALKTEGLPVSIEAVENRGRHRIVRARLAEYLLHVLVPEDGEIPAQAHAAFARAQVNVYADGHLIEPLKHGSEQGQDVSGKTMRWNKDGA